MQYESLYHHGIKGQRWGVRRYQNKDGSLTAAGKKRVNNNNKDDELTPEQRAARNKQIIERGSAKDVLSIKNEVSTQDLQRAYNRLNTEQLISQIDARNSQSVKSGLDRFQDIAKGIGTGANIAKSTVEVYGIIAKVNNSLNPKFKLPTLDGGKSLREKQLINTSKEDFLKDIGKHSLDDIKAYANLTNWTDSIRKGTPIKDFDEDD